ncbi:Na+/H+ antiporter subunit E [Nocardioides limicola]|uniref:Na+/H+ antiporter subunit E n=1 Tax=Nocardioides limicola TaxID=2803368 RepID=UPI00193C5022|nr:Na+/H+ antiporter subunit E [Nocardioides sp. DJM-14]
MTAYLSAGLCRALALGVCWWAVSEGETYGWPYGVVVVVLATALSLRLSPPSSGGVRPRRLAARTGALLGLIGWFLARSFAGGVVVAGQALSPRLPLDPGLVRHQLAIPPGTARSVVVGMISLMPGTLSAELDGDVLQVHALDVSADVRSQVAELEDRVGRVSGWARG